MTGFAGSRLARGSGAFGVARMLVACAAIGAVAPGVQMSEASATPPFGMYVALGDSWAADASLSQPTDEFVAPGCAQSRDNYAKQLARALAIPVFRDATCGGATTAHMTTPQSTLLGVNPPQFDRLTLSTDLVTLEIGGNDAGLAAMVPRCVTVDPAVSPCRNSLVATGVDEMSESIAAAAPKVAAVIEGVRARSPRARIVLLDYLDGVGTGPGCFPVVPISDVDANWLGTKLFELNTMLAGVARAVGVEFVDSYTASAGHDACQAPGARWVEGLIPFSTDPVGPAVPFHPNQLGADHQARSLLAALGR
ncbi:SGNH/GDSL hydrolase family protein [Nocardia sp. NPDC049190]|uniref:SGNH/GDSL hydrolase family protein n=1 Tax=Nocardia sp. NPDC049190 TaxID=3155650 RepID=UPI00340C988B